MQSVLCVDLVFCDLAVLSSGRFCVCVLFLFIFCRFFGLFYLDSHAICRLGQFWLFVVFKQFIPFLLSCQSYKSTVFLYHPFSSWRICSGIPCSSLNIGNSFFLPFSLLVLLKVYQLY